MRRPERPGKTRQTNCSPYITFLRERVAVLDDPRSIGDALKGSQLGDFWRYRVGDYHIISSIEDDIVCILVVKIGNRREMYR